MGKNVPTRSITVKTTHARRLVLGEHAVGVVVEVVLVGFVLHLAEAVDVLRRHQSRDLNEHIGEGETRQDRVPAEEGAGE